MAMRTETRRFTMVVITGLMFYPLSLKAQAQSDPRPSLDIFGARLNEKDPKTPEISTRELQDLLASGSVILLDTRPHLEWAISHIPGALNVAPKPGMPMSQYTSDVAAIARIVRGDKNRPL